MDNTKLAKFKRLTKSGLTSEQIMEKMGICKKTYYNYQREANVDRRKKEIDKQRYFQLIRQGYTTKVELAAKLGVSNHTLIAWEKRNETTAEICRGISVKGHKIILPGMLHISSDKVREYTNGTPTLGGITKNLKIIIGSLEKYAEYDPDANTTIRTITKAFNLMESVEMEAKLKVKVKL